MWFLPYPFAWSALWRQCRAECDQVKPSRPQCPRDARTEMLILGSIGRRAALPDALYLPAVMQLLLDDVCLQSALCYLAAQKPHWWQRRAADDWRREAELLEVERDRLTREATHLGSLLTTNDVEGRGHAKPEE